MSHTHNKYTLIYLQNIHPTTQHTHCQHKDLKFTHTQHKRIYKYPKYNDSSKKIEFRRELILHSTVPANVLVKFT